jgi:hypothetical protein
VEAEEVMSTNALLEAFANLLANQKLKDKAEAFCVQTFLSNKFLMSCLLMLTQRQLMRWSQELHQWLALADAYKKVINRCKLSTDARCVGPTNTMQSVWSVNHSSCSLGQDPMLAWNGTAPHKGHMRHQSDGFDLLGIVLCACLHHFPDICTRWIMRRTG